jgi:hypothetical protein
MRKLHLALALPLILAAATAFAGRQSVAASAYFTPPPEPGVIFTVINFARSGGTAQGTMVNVDWGLASRRLTVAPYQGICARTTPSGFVLKMRHPRPDSVPLTITTTGTIVRGPYQGEIPLEVLSPCYRLMG